MKKKVIVIGTNHAGTASINTMMDNYSDKLDVTTYDSNDNISFLGCGIALWVGGIIDNPDGLFYSSPDELRKKGAIVNMKTSVESVDTKTKTITVKNLETQETIKDTYDDLIIATGSIPIIPKISGIELENIFPVKLFQDAHKAIEKLNDTSIKNVTIVGAGYIGLELAEAYAKNGKNVTVIDVLEEVLPRYFDSNFSQLMEKKLKENNIKLMLGETVTGFTGKDGKVSQVITNKKTIDSDLVIMSIGFRPNTSMFKDSGIKFMENGAIITDNNQKTNIDGVYAVGDCSTVYNNASKQLSYIALATNAVRTGIVAGHNAGGTNIPMIGVQGSNAICIYDLTMCSTGLNQREAEKLGFNVKSTEITDLQKPAFMPSNYEVTLKIVYDADTRRVLGAQMASEHDITLALHMFSLAIQEEVTIDRLKLLDLFFLPHFNQPINYFVKATISAK